MSSVKCEFFLLFLNFQSLKWFCNSRGNLCTCFVMLDIKFVFTCSNLTLCFNIVKFQPILTRIVWNMFFCTLNFQWSLTFLIKVLIWLKSVSSIRELLQWSLTFLTKALIWLQSVSSIRKLTINKPKNFLESNFQLNQTYKIALTQNH